MRLEVLGGLRLVDAEGNPVQVQRRRLALLAIVAVAGRRGLGRDRLLLLLWPEATEAGARHALDQALYALRRPLGPQGLLRTDSGLALNPATLTVDLWEFREHLESGRFAQAVALYHGPLLDGFEFDESPEFSHWLDGERAPLVERFLATLATLGDAALAGGNALEAVEWWRRFQRIDPLSARGAIGLIKSLSASNDRAAALQYGRQYEALVRSEFGARADPAVRAAIEAAAITQDIPPSTMRAAEAERPAPVPATAAALAPSPPSAVALAPSPVDIIPALEPRGKPPAATGRRHPAVWLAAATIGVAAALAVGTRARRPPAEASAAPAGTVVFPFRVADSTGNLAYLSEAMVDFLALKFTGDAQMPMVPASAALAAWHGAGGVAEPDASPRLLSAARAVRASRVVTGSVVGSGDVLTLHAAVSDAETGRALMDLEVRGRRDSIPMLVDRLAAQLLLMTTKGEPQDLPDFAGTPMAALRTYVAGEAAAREGRFADAIRALREALDRDSTFALAALRLAAAAGWVAPAGTWDPAETRRDALRLAWRYRERLSTRDRALLAADAGPDYPLPSTEQAHIDAWSRAVNLAPDRADAWFGFGDYLFHSGPLIGRVDARRRAREAFSRAAALDSGLVAALGHLADLDALEGDTSRLRAVGAAYLRRSPGSDLADFVRWRVAAGTGDAAALRELRARWATMPLESLMRIANAMQSDALQLDELAAIAEALERRLYQSSDAQEVNELLVNLDLNRGRPSAAARRLRDFRERSSSERIAMRLAGDAVLAGGDRAAALEALAAFDEGDGTAPAVHCARGLVEAGHDAVRAGRARRALERRAAQRSADDSLGMAGKSAVCALALRVLMRGDDAPAALRQLDSAMLGGPPTFDVTTAGGENLIVAAALARLDRPAEALAAVRRRAYGGLWPTRFLADALREEGLLALATADTAGARRAWGHYLGLRARVEPGLEPERERVRAALAAVTAAR